MFGETTFEHNETAYGFNLRGFQAFVPHAFGSDPAKMEQFYNEIYVYGPDPRFPISPAAIAGAAAYKAVRSQDSQGPHKLQRPPLNYNDSLHSRAISSIKAIAAQEAHNLLERFRLPNIDPTIVILSAEAAAHRLYDHENFLYENFD